MAKTPTRQQDLSEDVGAAARPATDEEQDAAAKAEAKQHEEDAAAAGHVTGRPETPWGNRPVQSPPETEAQAAAGPHRPEPARPIVHDPGFVPAVPPAKAKAAGAPIKVRATQDGYYGDARRRAGSVFDISSVEDFSKKWMERVPASTPNRALTGQERIQQEHDAINAARVSGGRPATGDQRVLDE